MLRQSSSLSNRLDEVLGKLFLCSYHLDMYVLPVNRDQIRAQSVRFWGVLRRELEKDLFALAARREGVRCERARLHK